MFCRVNILPENKMTTPNGLAFVRLNISTLVIVLLLQCQVRIVFLQLINYKHSIISCKYTFTFDINYCTSQIYQRSKPLSFHLLKLIPQQP